MQGRCGRKTTWLSFTQICYRKIKRVSVDCVRTRVWRAGSFKVILIRWSPSVQLFLSASCFGLETCRWRNATTHCGITCASLSQHCWTPLVFQTSFWMLERALPRRTMDGFRRVAFRRKQQSLDVCAEDGECWRMVPQQLQDYCKSSVRPTCQKIHSKKKYIFTWFVFTLLKESC